MVLNYFKPGLPCLVNVQVLDVSVNKPFKSAMRLACHSYFADVVRAHVASGADVDKLHLDTRMSVMKPKLPEWVSGSAM